MSPDYRVGWWNSPIGVTAKKWHFYGEDGRSYCGKYMMLGGIRELGNDDSPDNCKACQREVKKWHPEGSAAAFAVAEAVST